MIFRPEAYGVEVVMDAEHKGAEVSASSGSIASNTQVVAAIDTNVFLDMNSCHDLINAFNADYAIVGAAAVDEPNVTYRIARAREAALLAIYFNKIGATTYSLHKEPDDLIKRKAPPAPTGTTMESDFVRVYLYFVKDLILPNWSRVMPTAPGSEASNGADDALIAYAKGSAIPLITNEGYTVRGLANEKMRKRAKDAGVDVYAPHEFYAGKINESDEIEAFFERFKEQAPLHLESRRTKFGPGDEMGHTLDWVFHYYRMILLGEVKGRDKPIRVRVV